MDWLFSLDKDFFLFLNGFHTPFFDKVMLLITNRLTWIPLYIFMIYFIVRHKTNGVQVILILILAAGLTDALIAQCLKPYFHRLRPCYDLSISSFTHVVGKCGGNYGLPSSHAANTFTLAFLVQKFIKNRTLTTLLFCWASLVSYSRIYIGVHFPLDILFGIFCAFIISNLFYILYLNFSKKQTN